MIVAVDVFGDSLPAAHHPNRRIMGVGWAAVKLPPVAHCFAYTVAKSRCVVFGDKSVNFQGVTLLLVKRLTGCE